MILIQDINEARDVQLFTTKKGLFEFMKENKLMWAKSLNMETNRIKDNLSYLIPKDSEKPFDDESYIFMVMYDVPIRSGTRQKFKTESVKAE